MKNEKIQLPKNIVNIVTEDNNELADENNNWFLVDDEEEEFNFKHTSHYNAFEYFSTSDANG